MITDQRLLIKFWRERALFARRIVGWLTLFLVAENLALAIYLLFDSFRG